MKFALVTLFSLLASFSVYAGNRHDNMRCEDEAPLFQNPPCGGWAVETSSLFNGDSDEHACSCRMSEDEAPLFQNQPCRGWVMYTQSLFNG